MNPLTSAQRKFLRSLAHHLDPVVYVGKQGVTDMVIQATDEALAAQELIKVRFIEFKKEKKALSDTIAQRAGAQIAGIIGHVAILYRPHPDEEKQKIELPSL